MYRLFLRAVLARVGVGGLCDGLGSVGSVFFCVGGGSTGCVLSVWMAAWTALGKKVSGCVVGGCWELELCFGGWCLRLD